MMIMKKSAIICSSISHALRDSQHKNYECHDPVRISYQQGQFSSNMQQTAFNYGKSLNM